MKCLLLANGEYGDITLYYALVQNADLIICADGGANYAYQMGITPHCIIGDMDSIQPDIKEYFTAQQVPFKDFPPAKDFTDTQLALALACEQGAQEIILLGTLGGRLDHTMANIYSCIEAVRQGKKISHFGPQLTIYMVSERLKLIGRPGDLVSLIVLTDKAEGVTLKSFAYPLQNALLYKEKPYAVSNQMTADTAEINIKSGIIAVFHYQ